MIVYPPAGTKPARQRRPLTTAIFEPHEKEKSMEDLTEHFVELVRRTSTDLPADVEKAIRAAREREERDSAAQGAFDTILENIQMSRGNSRPICQDTGT